MKFRLRVAVLMLFFACFSFDLQANTARIVRSPRLRSAAVIVKDQSTGEFLLAKQSEASMPIASITKLMTAMVILDARLDMEMTVNIEEFDKDTLRHSRSHLPVGTRLSRSQALLVALMASENRAAHALSRTFPGGVGAVVSAMNEKARSLGLTESRFEDPTGLSERNVSSARDLCRLVEAACHYPLICAYSTQKEFILQQERKALRFVNTNSLVRNRHWQIGLSKTGYIEEAGRCLVMQTMLAHRPLIIALLNASGRRTRVDDMMQIRRWLEDIESSQKPNKQRSKVSSSHRRSAHA
jgi:D-alanyl-D-alanine endopeptidase (penicillin-binding protein 7)